LNHTIDTNNLHKQSRTYSASTNGIYENIRERIIQEKYQSRFKQTTREHQRHRNHDIPNKLHTARTNYTQQTGDISTQHVGTQSTQNNSNIPNTERKIQQKTRTQPNYSNTTTNPQRDLSIHHRHTPRISDTQHIYTHTIQKRPHTSPSGESAPHYMRGDDKQIGKG